MARKKHVKKIKVPNPPKMPKRTAQGIAVDAAFWFRPNSSSIDDGARKTLATFLEVIRKNEKRLARDLSLVLSAMMRHKGQIEVQPAGVCKELLKQLAQDPNYKLQSSLVDPIRSYANAWATVLSFEASEKEAAKSKAKT